MNNSLVEYIEKEIIPQYQNFDLAHGVDHVRKVIDASMKMSVFYDVNPDMVFAIAAFHDTGLSVNREYHHMASGDIVRKDSFLPKIFTSSQIKEIAEAVEDHRASNKNEPRSIYGKIVAEADKLIDSTEIIRRTIQYGISHYPNFDKKEIWERTLEHLHEKYSEGGYLKLWIPESDNANRLKELQALIHDEKRLQSVFEKLYNEERIQAD